MKKTLTLSLIIILTLVTGLLLYSFEKEDVRFTEASENYTVVRKWELPDQLKEISGIDWLGNDKIAAVQDENGIIFIYDLKKKAIEEQINFGEGGDYEGIRISGNTAYVLRSDGTIFEVRDFQNEQPQTSQIKTYLAGQKGMDVEGLGLEKANKRLLLGVKENKKVKDSRGVYAYDLQNGESDKEPVFAVNTSDPIFEKGEFHPSEIEVNPTTGEYYILDAENFQLLITDPEGLPKKLHKLDKKEFGKPEGLSFTPEGTLYISNEADDSPANILQVELK